MKKISSFVLLIAMGFSFNQVSYAAVLNVGNGITTNDCEVLSDDVKPSLSKNVVLAYSCNKDQNLVKVASCHQFGSRKIETVTCAVVSEDEDGEDVWNDSSCTSTTMTFKTGNFGKAYLGSSSGGSVAAADLGAACEETGSAVDALVE